MSHEVPSYDEVHALLAKFAKANREHWLRDDLFSFNWWLMLVVTVLFYVIWLRIINKSRLTEILLFGAFVTIMSTIIDVVGVNLLWWGYPNNLLPIVPAFLVLDLSQVPITFAVVYQRYGYNSKYFFIAMAILSAVYSFGVEPLLSWLGIYRLHQWHYYYSFPLYILVAFLARFAVRYIRRTEQRAARRKEIH
ncbi:MAG: CBO0543 family protein [Tumebacillaceae bacterium]